MKRNIFIYLLFTAILISKAVSVPFEKKEPRDERTVLVPKGAQPLLKEETPQGQLVVDRIKARHRYALSIPFSYAWNTAALTAITGLEEEPQVWDNREAGFALHSQRLRVGSLKNKEYFQRETAGFPEGRYWPMPLLEDVNVSKGYMSTNFVHIVLKQVRNKYSYYTSSDDRISGMFNAIVKRDQSLNITAQRKMQNMWTEGDPSQPRIRNNAGISYKNIKEGVNKLEIQGSSVWSTITDSQQNDYRYIFGEGFFEFGKGLSAGFDVDFKTKLQISTLRDQTDKKNIRDVETRKFGWVEASNIASPVKFIQFILNASALYDSKYKGFVTPSFELAFVPKAVQFRAGLRRKAILPDYDELYWNSKFVKLNESLQPENFWEAYGSLNIDIITRLRLRIQADYSRPESRITWEQLPGYIWQPVNKPTEYALTGEASLEVNLVKDFNIFSNYKYQRFDKQYFDPQNLINAGISYGNALVGSITLGGCFWNFQPINITESPEEIIFAYLRINKSLKRVINIFLDGRYTIDREDIVYYRGIPQAGRIVSVGVNIVFGGLD